MDESPVILEWVEKGRQEALAEGGLHWRQNCIIMVLEIRFRRSIPSNLRTMIEAQSDPTRLDAWLRQAIMAKSPEAFRATIAHS